MNKVEVSEIFLRKVHQLLYELQQYEEYLEEKFPGEDTIWLEAHTLAREINNIIKREKYLWQE